MNYYQHDNYIVGIEDKADCSVIADVLSATFSIPLGVKAEFNEQGFVVDGLKFTKIPKPDTYNRYDKIYK